MPARKSPALGKEHAAKTRAKIRSSSLVLRLQQHVLRDKPMEMSQIRAAEILLRKTVPDLTSTELSNADGGPVQIQVVRFSDLPPA